MSPLRSNLLALLLLPLLVLSGRQAQAQEQPAEHPLLERTDAIAQRVGQIRGRPLLSPLLTGVKTRDQLRIDLAERLKAEYAPGEIQGEATLLKQLGLMEEALDYEAFLLDLLTEQIAGYYDTIRGNLVLIEGTDDSFAGPAMAHEIFHALQDQHFTLLRLHPPRSGQAGSFTNGDRALARASLIEGDATVLMIDWLLHEQGALAQGSQQSFVDFPVYSTLIESVLKQNTPTTPILKAAPLILRRSLESPYLDGLRFVQALRTGHTWAEFDAVYADPPESTEQVLHPDRYLNRDAPTLLALHTPDLLPHLPPGDAPWTAAYENVLGELRLGVYLEQLGLSGSDAAEAAAGWDGDRFYAFTRPGPTPGRLALAITTWDSTDDAEQFMEALRDAQQRRLPKATLHRDSGPHGALACLHDPEHGRVLIERWGEHVLLIDGAPERDDQGRTYDLTALRAAAWKARRTGVYPPPVPPQPLKR